MGELVGGVGANRAQVSSFENRRINPSAEAFLPPRDRSRQLRGLLGGEWNQIIPDRRSVAAIVDRVTLNAHAIETGTDSYRLCATKTSARRKTA